MAEEHYARLSLYFGLCPDMKGIPEGALDNPIADKREQYRRQSAMESVQRSLRPGYREWALSYGYPSLVRNDNEAQALIKFSEQNIPGSSGIIILCDCSHGKIRFLREIEFPEFRESQRIDLLAKLKMSGIVPQKQSRFDKDDDVWNRLLKFF